MAKPAVDDRNKDPQGVLTENLAGIKLKSLNVVEKSLPTGAAGSRCSFLPAAARAILQLLASHPFRRLAGWC